MANIDQLLDIMTRLRGENGCPWDREQTLESLKPFMIEESYEVIDAIDAKDSKEHCEELGDVLLQLVFQAEIAREAGDFAFQDVIDAISRKMIHRHPHVFGDDETIKSAGDVLEKWDDFKRQEGKKITFFGNIPKHFPALLESLKINKKAAKTGFDWREKEDIFDKLVEEVEEFQDAESDAHRFEELGDILFVIVNLARRYKIDPEAALKASNKKFKSRFEGMLQLAKEQGIEFSSLELEQMDQLWGDVKEKERQRI